MAEKGQDREQLEADFWQYVEIGNAMAPQTADNMLVAYAYYKQATEGDTNAERPTASSNVVQAFKYDAWKRLEGMPKEEAMKKYIATIKKLKEEEQ
ncbi:MAG: acyl-CoA-binding protein [Schleiferiaceae bacterium]|nr:acyl-CoA-binding protein [Schleiferiaceae bacterium]MDR9442499.1 acyl-CoA-binding protein [Schleiferiaceae bacterium]